MNAYNIYNADELAQWKTGTQIEGKWYLARPMRDSSLLNRIKMAWLVLTDQIDGIRWYKQ